MRFIERFSKRLNEEYVKRKGSDAEFARKLDVSRAALKKYLAGTAMPGVRTVALAYANLNINVSYGKFDAKMLRSRARSDRQSVEAQLLLPFAIESLREENIDIALVDKKPNRIELNLSIRFASRPSA
ncbi:MAG: helix-turn-helix transcriptional regulator [Candidatus Sulfotelmatobacter sp.]